MTERRRLETRNALWQRLRQHTPGEAGAEREVFEAALHELETLTGWSRARILAGLGISEAELAQAQP